MVAGGFQVNPMGPDASGVTVLANNPAPLVQFGTPGGPTTVVNNG